MWRYGAERSAGWPNHAHAFSAIIGKGTLPKTVNAAEQRVTKCVQLAVGETLPVELPVNPDSGYAWTVSPLAVDGVIEPVGDVSFAPETDAMRSPACVVTSRRAAPRPLLAVRGAGRVQFSPKRCMSASSAPK